MQRSEAFHPHYYCSMDYENALYSILMCMCNSANSVLLLSVFVYVFLCLDPMSVEVSSAALVGLWHQVQIAALNVSKKKRKSFINFK